MTDDLNQRFDYMTDETFPNFDCIYLLSTALDPNYRLFVREEQAAKNLCKKYVGVVASQLVRSLEQELNCFILSLKFTASTSNILNALTFYSKLFQGLSEGSKKPPTQQVDSNVGNPAAPGDSSNANEPTQPESSGKPRTLDPSGFSLLYAQTVAKRAARRRGTESIIEAQASVGTGVAVPPTHIATKIEEEFVKYMNMELPFETREEKEPPKMIDAIGFWRENFKDYPLLSKLSYTLLALQSSSAASEREFSIAGWHVAGRKNRLDKGNLAAKVFLTCNKRLLRPIIFKDQNPNSEYSLIPASCQVLTLIV